jgi:hypothetical protein
MCYGVKCQLLMGCVDESNRDVPTADAVRFAEADGLLFKEANVKSGDGVEDAFVRVSRQGAQRARLTTYGVFSDFGLTVCCEDSPPASSSRRPVRRPRRRQKAACCLSPGATLLPYSFLSVCLSVAPPSSRLPPSQYH